MPYTTFWPVRQHLCGAGVILEAGSLRPFDAESGEYHHCDYAAALGRVPRTLLCSCGVVVRQHADGHRDDAATGEPHVHQPPPQPEREAAPPSAAAPTAGGVSLAYEEDSA